MLYLLFFILFAYLAVSTLYLLVLAVAGALAASKKLTVHPLKKRIAVLIPAYREDVIIVDTAISAAMHDYPAEFFQVLVIADSLKRETVEKLRNIPVTVLEVHFDLSTKARSLNAGLSYLQHDQYEIAMILDADNIMETGCLEKINDAFWSGSVAVQCHRTAKNENSYIALLGAISEEININIFRRGPASLGLSAAPLGSGMALRFEILNNIFSAPEILDNLAEDREVEIQLMKAKRRMEFLNDVYVYDEKVTERGAFEKQRIRWLEAQMGHIKRFFEPDMKDVPKTAVYFHTFLQNLLLPRVLYILIGCMVAFMLTIQWIFSASFMYPVYTWWLAWLGTYIFVLAISVPAKFYSLKTARALVYVPVLIISMLKAVVKMKGNRKEFLHTTKTFSVKK